MPTVEDALEAGGDGFRLGMATAADIVEKLCHVPLPDTPGISSDVREVVDATRRATLQNVAKLLRDTIPAKA